MSENRISFNRYPRFFIIGSGVGIATVMLRELIDMMLVAGGKIEYLISICGAYGFGIIASFTLQRVFTFQYDREKRTRDHFLPFTFVAIAGGVLVALLSFLFRYALSFDSFLNQYAASVAFMTASILVSVLSYWVNVKYVFR